MQPYHINTFTLELSYELLRSNSLHGLSGAGEWGLEGAHQEGGEVLSKDLCSFHPPIKLLPVVMEGFKSQSARQRACGRWREGKGEEDTVLLGCCSCKPLEVVLPYCAGQCWLCNDFHIQSRACSCDDQAVVHVPILHIHKIVIPPPLPNYHPGSTPKTINFEYNC